MEQVSAQIILIQIILFITHKNLTCFPTNQIEILWYLTPQLMMVRVTI